MDNNGHAAALIRAVLMPLLMGRHRCCGSWHSADFFRGPAASWAGFPIPSERLASTPGGGRAWGLRGRQPLSAVLTRTGEGGGRVQSHPAPKPGGRTQSGGGARGGRGVRGYVAASPRCLLFHITTVRVLNNMLNLENRNRNRNRNR
jgi:hypothetical protein